jgi:signal transduction histidine kinase
MIVCYLTYRLQRALDKLDLEIYSFRFFRSLTDYFTALSRREKALSLQLGNSLFSNINFILNASLDVLPISSAELTLVDRETNVYHGSFLAGAPFRTDINLSFRDGVVKRISKSLEVREYQEYDRLLVMLPIAVAKKNLGLLRFKFNPNIDPDKYDWEVISILALQCMRALVEDNFTVKVLRMREGAETAVKTKTGFLAHFSHELRGPLGIILNAVQLVLEEVCGEVTEDQRDTLNVAHRNGKHVLELVNDVLDFARVESGRMPTTPESIDVEEMLDDIINITSKVAETKGHTLQKGKVSGTPISFHCDRRHSRQILINLITNAIKYTPENGIIEVWGDLIDDQWVRINVRDNGIGISLEDQDKVFMPFVRIERGYASEQVGTGIGMSLTRELVELNGGKIDFWSQPKQGTHFWVDFKRASNVVTNATNDDQARNMDGKFVSVLLYLSVNQEEQMISRYLEHHNFKVLIARNYSDISNAILRNKVEVVVLDAIYIENGDVARISALLELGNGARRIPIIAISGSAFSSDIENVIRAGVQLCLLRPLDLEKLGQACLDVQMPSTG